jgi:hypothetical protein
MNTKPELDEQIKQFVLNSVADDYESLEILQRDSIRTAQTYGIALERERVLQILQELIQDGLIQAYTFIPPRNEPIAVPFTKDILDELWFFITASGRERLLEGWWPE